VWAVFAAVLERELGLERDPDPDPAPARPGGASAVAGIGPAEKPPQDVDGYLEGRAEGPAGREGRVDDHWL
jgi:hypothetical protein